MTIMWIIDDILSKINIVDIVWEYVDLKKSWNNYKWLCPFHNEKTPSFIVSEDKQIFKCFWCWKWWNVITFMKEIENLDFYETIKVLASKAGIELKDYKANFETDQKDINKKSTLIELNKTALNFFHKKLFENESALNYLMKERKLSKEIIIKYKLWYTWTKKTEFIEYMIKKWFKQEDIVEVGLARKSSSWSLYPFFSNRIIFPIFSSIWEVIAFSWRIFNWETNTWKYINTPETILYNKSSILYNFNNAKKSKKDFIIVCEGYMDVIWANRLWYENAVATCWTALTQRHITLLKRVTKNIIFAFDSDEAGLQATLRWVKIALNLWIYPWIFQISWWKDFDDIANNGENIDIQKNKKDAVLYLMDYFLKDYKQVWPTQKQEKLEQIFDILRQIENSIIMNDYCEELWKKINENANIIKQQIKLKKKNIIKKEVNNDEEKDMIPALLYEDFYKKFVSNDDVEKIIKTIVPILDYIDNTNIIKQVITKKIEKNEYLKLKQLKWEEKNLIWLTQNKIDERLKSEVKNYIINMLTWIIKNQQTKNKLEIMKVLNKIKKEK